MDYLIHHIDHAIFMPIKGHVHSIECQKHGLTHMHLLVFLDSDETSTNITPAFIDNIICAELLPENSPI